MIPTFRKIYMNENPRLATDEIARQAIETRYIHL